MSSKELKITIVEPEDFEVWDEDSGDSFIGRRFDRWEVTGLAEDRVSPSGYRSRMLKCRCDCGTCRDVEQRSLLRGKSSSCGCLQKEVIIKASWKHGMANSTSYNIWIGMKKRCYNENAKNYDDYGGRGIKVSDEWLSSFENFHRDMGERPSSKHTIERIDVNGDYCKENCIWTDDGSLQAYNQRVRSTNKSGRTGVHAVGDMWEARIRGRRLIRTPDYELAVFCREEAELFYYGFIKE